MLATDGSASGKNAERCFSSFMEKSNPGLLVQVEDANRADSSALEALGNQYADVSVQRLKGSPGKEIVKAAHQEDVTLLIVGKRGETPISDLLLGSVAEYIARESHNPVLLVP
jgi:nucleotide-binding universal stress UspA family protein